MPDTRVPGLIWDPGLNAGYRKGTNRMEKLKQHFTAGVNSYGICKNNGLTQALLPKEGVPWQFAEWDALCFDSGDWNPSGPSLEVERLGTGIWLRPGLQQGETPTLNQIFWLNHICQWSHDEWGTPFELFPGPQFGGNAYIGNINHGDLDSQRSDGLTPAEWEAVKNPSENGADVAQDNLYITLQPNPEVGVWVTNGIYRRWVGPDEWWWINQTHAYFGMNPPHVVPVLQGWWDSLPVPAEVTVDVDEAAIAAQLATLLGDVGGATAAEIGAAVDQAMRNIFADAADPDN